MTNDKKMCETVETGQFYGYDQDLPCVSKAAFEVKYRMYIPYDAETHETDFWLDCTESACDKHRGQMVTWAEEHPKLMQIDAVTLLPGIETVLPETDIQPKSDKEAGPIDWYLWYENLNPDSRH